MAIGEAVVQVRLMDVDEVKEAIERIGTERGELYAMLSNIVTAKRTGELWALLREANRAERLLEEFDRRRAEREAASAAEYEELFGGLGEQGQPIITGTAERPRREL